MDFRGRSGLTILLFIIRAYRTYTWTKTEVAVAIPMIRPQELTFPTGVFVPGLENPPMPLHELVLLIDAGMDVSGADPDYDSEWIDTDSD